MKITKIDRLGRVVIPKSMREKLGLLANSDVCISVEDCCIQIMAADRRCALCCKRLTDNTEISICEECITKIKQL